MILNLDTFPRYSQMDQSFMIDLAKFFVKLNPPDYTITSTFRTASENEAVGGVSNSYHLTGRAADIVFNGVNFLDVVKAGALSPLKILYYPLKNYYHIQSSPVPVVFIGIGGEYTQFNWIDQNIVIYLILGAIGAWILFSR